MYRSNLQNKDILIVGILMLIPVFLIIVVILYKTDNIIKSRYIINLVENKGLLRLELSGTHSIVEIRFYSVDGSHFYSFMINMLNSKITDMDNFSDSALEIEIENEIHGNVVFFKLTKTKGDSSILSNKIIVDVSVDNKNIIF